MFDALTAFVLIGLLLVLVALGVHIAVALGLASVAGVYLLTRDADIVLALAEQAGMETVDLATVTPQQEALELVDSSMAHAFTVIPLRLEGDVLTVALGDPQNTVVLQDLGFSTGKEVRGAVADAESIKKAVLEHYGEESSIADAIAEAAAAVSGADPESAAASQPVARQMTQVMAIAK